MKIGDSGTYPEIMQGWERISKLPENVAWAWLAEVFPRDAAEFIGNTPTDSFHEYRYPVGISRIAHNDKIIQSFWLNKLYIVVGETRKFGDVIALYKHDDSFWLIRNNRVRLEKS